jgi:hypothetical protein
MCKTISENKIIISQQINQWSLENVQVNTWTNGLLCMSKIAALTSYASIVFFYLTRWILMIKVMHITKLEPGRYTWITEIISYLSDSNYYKL